MNPSIMQEITLLKEFLANEQDLGIVIGAQTLDSYASALALFLTLSNSSKKVQIISKKQPTVEVSNLVGIDKVKQNFIGNTSKLVVALPYVKGEVEKVLFTEAPNTINFHLTAVEGKSITPFALSDVKLMWEGGAPGAIIAIGIGNLDDLTGTVDTSASRIVNIDNFQTNTRYGDVVLVDESFSSLSEVVGKIIKELNLPIDIDSAQNILDGVLFATRNFTKPNTSPFAFEAVSAAMYVGAKRKNEEQPRGDNRMENQGRSSQQVQDRGRDQRQQPNRQPRVANTDFPAMHMQGNRNQNPFGDAQGKPFGDASSNSAGRQDRGQNNDNRRAGQQRTQDSRDNSRDYAPRANRQYGAPQQFGEKSNDIEELMRKIKEENARKSGGQQFGQNRQQTPQQNFSQPQNDEEQDMQPPIQDAQIINDPIQPQMSQPTEDTKMPEDQRATTLTNEEIPDDWLMPKVFKSSKNNN